MNQESTHPDHHLFAGTARVFLAEALVLPTGLVTAAYLTRTLGPSDYGIFTLAATVIAWVEWSVTSIFGRATFKFIAEAEDWRPLATTIIRIHLIAGCIAAFALWLLSAPIATLLQEPSLSSVIALFAIDIPLFCLAQACRNILIGLGRFQQRAWISAARWIARLIFILLLLALGFSLTGAVVASILATVIELLFAWFYLRPPVSHPLKFPVSQLWNYALPLFFFAMSMRVYEKLDLVMLKILGGTAADAGVYGAAQNLSLVVSIFALSFSPLLLSTLSTLLKKDENDARKTAAQAMQLVIGLVPFAAMTAGCSTEIVGFVFGKSFLSSAPILSFLIFSGLSLAMISVTTAILTAGGRPALSFVLCGPLVLFSLIGYVLLIPHSGAVGAAMVNCTIAALGAIITIVAVWKYFRALPPMATVVRSGALSGITYFLARWWEAAGLVLVAKVIALSLFIVFGFILLRELKIEDLMRLRAFRQQRSNAS